MIEKNKNRSPLEFLAEISAWLSFNVSPSKDQLLVLKNDLDKYLEEHKFILENPDLFLVTVKREMEDTYTFHIRCNGHPTETQILDAIERENIGFNLNYESYIYERVFE